MATAEAETSQDERASPGGLVYDGFISYSHATDDLLAPRLQAGLQRFAKPWWKRRALRIFRDESSLSANPHLWSSITTALDQSDWFVLLLSPDAAESVWVNTEVEYWLEHKDADRIIPVVTDGEFTWSETEIDLESTAAPPALYGAFSDEPRWVDLRFARSEEQLDLNNPRFSAAVADIASAIRQVPKDELESEEVLQHRRTVRTAWAVGAGLLILALLAGGAALFALDQRNDAVANASRAAENATEANEQRQAAEAAAAEAEEAKQEAEQQAAIATARELTLEAEKALESDPELSAHLALAALASFRQSDDDPAQAVSVLRSAIANDRVIFRVPGGRFVAVHPDGSLLATSDIVADEYVGVAVWDIASREVVERYARPDGVDPGNGWHVAAFSPDGTLLAVYFENADPSMTVWDRTTGESFHFGTGDFYPGFSPDGEFLVLYAGEDETGANLGLEVWSVTERQVVYRDVEGLQGADFNADGLMSYAANSAEFLNQGSPENNQAEVRVVDTASWELVVTFPTDLLVLQFTAWSPDGSQIAAGAQDGNAIVIEVETGTEVARVADVGRLSTPEWLPAGDAFVVGGELNPRIIEATTGEVRTELVGLIGGTWSYQVVPGTTLMASASLGGSDTVIFETSHLGGVEVDGWVAPTGAATVDYVGDGDRAVVSDLFTTYLTADALDGSEARSLEGDLGGSRVEVSGNGRFVASAGPDGIWRVRTADTDEVIYEAPESMLIRGVSWDGTQALIHPPWTEECRPALVSTIDGSIATELPDAHCFRAFFSADGKLVYTDTKVVDFQGIFDTESGELRGTALEWPMNGFEAAFTPDGSSLVLASWEGTVFVFDVAALLAGVPANEALVRKIPAHDSAAMRVSVSPDGTKIASWGWTDPVKVWDLATGQLLGEFGNRIDDGRFRQADFHPSLQHLIVTSPPNLVRIHILDTDELVAIATDGLSRDMTEQECQQYFHGPCPAP